MSTDGQTGYTVLVPSEWAREKCAGNVRWQGDKLQQLFEITEFIGNVPAGHREEWRDVPKEIAP